MPNWDDGEGGCDCPSGNEAGLGRHRSGQPGCISGPAEFVGKKTKTVTTLIEESSLGTPEAKKLRSSVPQSVVDRVLRRADELAQQREENDHDEIE